MTRQRLILSLLGLGVLLAPSACREDSKPSAPSNATPSDPLPEGNAPTPTLPDSRPPAAEPQNPTTAPSRPTSVRPTTSATTQPAVISMQAPTTAPDSAATKVAEFAGLAAPKPATWLWQPPPPGDMYLADYVAPGRDGHDQARITIFRIGGSIQQNIDRWKGQFRSADGQPVEPKISELEVNGMDVTMVELAGEYMGMGAPSFTADRLFITAIVQAPSGQIFIRFVGPTATVESNRQAFMEMIQGLREAEPQK